MFATLTSWENLLRAWRKASRGKRGQPGVAAFEHRLEDNLIALRSELREHTYRPGAYTSFYIHEPKRRPRGILSSSSWSRRWRTPCNSWDLGAQLQFRKPRRGSGK